MLNFEQVRMLTFDCYGTLIDWESGILGCLRPILEAHERILGDDHILQLYSELERIEQSGNYLRYRDVLQNVVRGIGARLNITPTLAEIQSLPGSLPDWQPFPDTVPALHALSSKYKLAVISNIDDDLFAGTARRLEVNFEHVITAEQARSYKPALNNFQMALGRIGLPRERVLHVAESLFHDVAPANALGVPCVWVNRRRRRQGAAASGGVAAGTALPDLEVPDMASLAAMAVGRAAE